MREAETWMLIGAIVIASTSGDILTARAMKSLGDLDEIRAHRGIWGAIKMVVTNRILLAGVLFMAIGFFSLLTALSWADVSLVAPASASLTFVTNAVAARLLLHEDVNRRRWISAILVCCGVALLAK